MPARKHMPRTASAHRSQLFVEELESRRVPATLVNPTTVTYRDVDGDRVRIELSKPLFDAATVNTVLLFNTSSVNGNNNTSQQLQKVDFGILGGAAAGVSVTISAEQANGGNGLVNVGAITSLHNLKDVSVEGDLGRVEAHTFSGGGTRALRSLQVRSLGTLGTTTQRSPGASLESSLFGSVGNINVTLDVLNAFINVQQRVGVGDGDAGSPGALDAVFIGGSLRGGTAPNSGRIEADGDIGPVTVKGNIVGGAGTDSGTIESDGALGMVTVDANVQAGTTMNTGYLQAGTTIAGVTIGGSLISGGRTGSGRIEAGGTIGPVEIGLDVQDGRIVSTGGGIRSVLIKGTLTSGPASVPGSIQAENAIKTIEIRGDVIGTMAFPAVISARGKAVVPAGSSQDVAIKRIQIDGRIEFGDILAGYNTGLLGVNADAQINKVIVGGDWIQTVIAAGARPGSDGRFGTSNDIKMSGPGVKDDAAILSRIRSITIAGIVRGSTGGTDHYGFVAERVHALQVNGALIALQAGAHNDRGVAVGTTGDVTVYEI